MRSFSFCFFGYIILVFILILCSDSIYPIMDLNKERISFTAHASGQLLLAAIQQAENSAARLYESYMTIHCKRKKDLPAHSYELCIG